MRRLLKVCAAALIATGLAGCVSNNFGTNADFSSVTPKVQPLREGPYTSIANGQPKPFGTFTKLENGDYALTGLGENDDEPQDVRLSFFGPIDGLFIAQTNSFTEDAGGGAYQNFIVRIGMNGSISLTDDEPVQAALGEMLFGDLGIPARGGVEILTDNAALNWALIQRLIVRYGKTFTFGTELTPAAR